MRGQLKGIGINAFLKISGRNVAKWDSKACRRPRNMVAVDWILCLLPWHSRLLVMVVQTEALCFPLARTSFRVLCPSGDTEATTKSAVKIGRASCRERV